MHALRRTKIISTLGPATDDRQALQKLIEAGVDAVRVNFSHGTVADHARRIQAVRECAITLNKEIGVIADLQGPKIRIARFAEGSVFLEPGAEFVLDANMAEEAGTAAGVGIDYKQLISDVSSGDMLLLDDGRLSLEVQKVIDARIICRVIIGGTLSNNKGINRLGGGLSAEALTLKDREDIKTAVELGADYIAISFPRTAKDIAGARALIIAAGGTDVGIIAKIERSEAVRALKEIIKASDAVMVARGDLGVEIGDAELPAVQKRIIGCARSLNKVVITATQMMESMIHNTIPTRAEVFDVANAVLDGTDAVMLSAETATGNHPDKVVAAMARICLGAERQPRAYTSGHRVECRFHRVDEAIAMATMYTANHFDIKAIIALTESGATPLWMSRIRSGIAVFGYSPNMSTLRRMTLYRGVYPVRFHDASSDFMQVEQHAVTELKERNIVECGEHVILTRGEVLGSHGGTSVMKIIKVV